jgi:hypothetical protein
MSYTSLYISFYVNSEWYSNRSSTTLVQQSSGGGVPHHRDPNAPPDPFHDHKYTTSSSSNSNNNSNNMREYRRRINQITAGRSYIDLYCQIQMVDMKEKHIFVWDGTDCTLPLT